MLFRRCIGFVLGAGSTNTNPKSQLNNHRLLDLYSLRHLVKNPPVVFCVWTFYLKHWFYLYNRTNFAFDVFFCSVFNLLFFIGSLMNSYMGYVLLKLISVNTQCVLSTDCCHPLRLNVWLVAPSDVIVIVWPSCWPPYMLTLHDQLLFLLWYCSTSVVVELPEKERLTVLMAPVMPPLAILVLDSTFRLSVIVDL